MNTHPKKERTYVMIKADGVQRSLVGESIKRFEQAGLKLVAVKMFRPTAEQAEKFYYKDDAWCEEKGNIMIKNLEKRGEAATKTAVEYGRGIVKTLTTYLTAGPVVGMVLEGNQAVKIAMKLIGPTEPLSADVGTLRGDYTIDTYEMANLDNRSVRNLIHRSDDPENAANEIALWLDPKDLMDYRHINEAVLYDVNLDGTPE